MTTIRLEEPGDVVSIRGVPDEAFMILILDQNAMRNVSGVARYRDEFGEAM